MGGVGGPGLDMLRGAGGGPGLAKPTVEVPGPVKY